MLISSRQRLALAVAVLGALAAPVQAVAAPPTRPGRPATPPVRRVFAQLRGVVQSVDANAGTLVVSVSRANGGRAARALVGTDLNLALAQNAVVRLAGQSGPGTLADVNVGDRVVVFAVGTTAPGSTFTADLVFDRGPAPGTAPPPPPTTWSFTGTVSTIDSAGPTVGVTVTSTTGAPSTYVGTLQQFAISSSTTFTVADNNGDGVSNLGDVSVGDTVTITLTAPSPVPTLGSVLTAGTLSDSATTPISTGGSGGSSGGTGSVPAPS